MHALFYDMISYCFAMLEAVTFIHDIIIFNLLVAVNFLMSLSLRACFKYLWSLSWEVVNSSYPYQNIQRKQVHSFPHHFPFILCIFPFCHRDMNTRAKTRPAPVLPYSAPKSPMLFTFSHFVKSRERLGYA